MQDPDKLNMQREEKVVEHFTWIVCAHIALDR